MPTSPVSHELRYGGELFSMISCDFHENVKARIADPLCGDLPFNGGFFSQRANHSENIYLLWHHHIIFCWTKSLNQFSLYYCDVSDWLWNDWFTCMWHRSRRSNAHIMFTYALTRDIHQIINSISNSRVSKLASLLQKNQTNNNKDIKSRRYWPFVNRPVVNSGLSSKSNAESVSMLWRRGEKDGCYGVSPWYECYTIFLVICISIGSGKGLMPSGGKWGNINHPALQIVWDMHRVRHDNAVLR